MAIIDIKVPDIGDFAEVGVIEVLVKPGDTVRGQFRVEQVSADAVQLTDTASNQLFTLTLR